MSLEAEQRVNASTTDPGSTVEQSALTRDRVEDLMLERESQFREKQEEHARLLDELAGKLQSLDLSAAAELVGLRGLCMGLPLPGNDRFCKKVLCVDEWVGNSTHKLCSLA